LPGLEPVESTGDNMFTVALNGRNVGTVGSLESLEDYLRQARLKLASESETPVFVETEITAQGREAYFGKIDKEDTVIQNMYDVLKQDIIQTTKRAYTVKINEYVVNLAGSDEVAGLLQAALDKYQPSKQFRVELVLDPTRELNVLTPDVLSKEEVENAAFQIPQAGVAKVLTDMLSDVESNGEKSFEDFEYGLTELAFGDEVEVVESYLPQSEIQDYNKTVEEVTKDQEVNTVYEVVAGDTLSEIAITTNVPLDKIIELNESLEDENSTIRIGDELIITMPEPKLSVERREEVYYEEDYEAEVEYVYNDDWYTTDSAVLQQPSAGHRKVAASVAYRNDKEVSTEILKEEVTFPAVAKVVEIGTKVPPTYIKPISGGRLSSRFGRRNAPTRGASTYHKGVDWATPTGTAVFASSAGKVTRAGWGSGYGYVVYIQHADGRETRYGHLSKVLVKAGQYVEQGDKIALSGNTGRSTGPHLHFEMRINGNPVDPLANLN